MEEYKYAPLRENEIRLLEIQPGRDLEMISCRLVHFFLNQILKYAALSYAWGAETTDREISMDGGSLLVNPNLEGALLEFRKRPVLFIPDDHPDEPPVLPRELSLIWIDAICINQKNLEERGEQVKLMQNIYKGASSLIVWLGTESDHSIAFSVLRKFDKQLSITPAPGERSTEQLDASEEELAAIIKLFSRPWFTRYWILQEYTLGDPPQKLQETVTFWCGKDRIHHLVQLGVNVIHQNMDQLDIQSSNAWSKLYMAVGLSGV
jgi:hypothetical protein